MNYKLAFALGLIPPGVVGREPVAYLYNGVVLPKLPKVPAGFEYATILCMDTTSLGGGKAYFLNYSTERPTAASVSAPRFEYQFSSGTNTWIENGEKDESTGITTFVDWLWTNTDILNTDGTVRLAATVPIPVYD